MRLFIVSNRLPISIKEKNGVFKVEKSPGGLVSGLVTYLESLKRSRDGIEYVWVGWPGIAGDKHLAKEVPFTPELLPVFLSKQQVDDFYYGFCNDTIWPLFHSFSSYTSYNQEQWNSYKEVNEQFADTILKQVKPDDIVWVHDYQLMLLPKLLRDRMPELSIGFFLHIPFPPFEMYRLLPKRWRSSILHGLLGANLIGFHTHDYTQYFLGCVTRILGIDHTVGDIRVDHHFAHVDTFPMGIDFQRFLKASQSKTVEKERKKLQAITKQFKVILSVDRLDYTKGIIKRLEGYALFLEKNPSWHGKVVLNLIVVPSREGVDRYQEMKREIDELVGKINGHFGTLEWTPILYQYKSFGFNSLVALYSASDVALVTPLRDGMNLVAKEYIASRHDQTGVLVLSEMAGAARELGEALVINPNHTEEISDAILEALTMSPEEQIARNKVMQARLRQYNIIRWATDFVTTLKNTPHAQGQLQIKWLNALAQGQIIKQFRKSKRRLVLLDYDGTLTPIVKYPFLARPSAELFSLLQKLGELPDTTVAIISGRDKHTLSSWLGSLPVHLVAEHGAWSKEPNGEWILSNNFTNDWKEQILPLMRLYADRLPGSFVEEKEYSAVWHYRNADPELASLRAKELTDNLLNLVANTNVQVLNGKKIVEVRNASANKGVLATQLLQKYPADFILAAGDDATDEDMFEVLPEDSCSIKVGGNQSFAHYHVHHPEEILSLLKALVKPQREET